MSVATYLSLVILGATAAGCEQGSTDTPGNPDVSPGRDTNIGSPLPDNAIGSVERKGMGDEVSEAEADLEAVEGSEIDGDIEFKQVASGVDVVVSIDRARAGKHGIHIHEKGDCSDIAAKSMGGHFNPENYAHALPAEELQRHLGDLGNIEINADGKGEITLTIIGATLKAGDPNSLLGRAFVVHDGEDLGKAKQPAGDSGSPIACGVIEKD